jgi:hypothetical protein
MSSIWVIFIDTSGSMAEPFSGTDEFDGVFEKGAYQTKLEAAKVYILRSITGIKSGDIAVIAFESQPHLVCKGKAKDVENFQKPINDLQTGDMTNLAAAFLFSLSELSNLKSYKVVNFLVISDGLSNVGDPEAAVKECDSKLERLQISTILIDPTPDGQRIADLISINGGEVKAVTSSIKLEGAITERQDAHKVATIAAARETLVQQVIASLAAVVGLAVVISGIYTAIVERPNIAIPAFIASLATIGGIALFYVPLAKIEVQGFYRNAIPTIEPPREKVPKYDKRFRICSGIGGLVLIALAISLVMMIYFKSSSSIQQYIVATATPTFVYNETPIVTPTGTPTP